MKLTINNVPGYSGVIDVKTDKHGTILDRFWRRRLKDSLIDGCVEIVKPKQEKAK